MSDLERLRELEKKATPGPWEIYTSNSWRRIGLGTGYREIIYPTTSPHDRHPDLAGPNCDNDLALLIALRNALPSLLASHDQIREQAIREAAAVCAKTRDKYAAEHVAKHGDNSMGEWGLFEGGYNTATSNCEHAILALLPERRDG